MASRAVVCCLSWQWTDTDSYPAVCCDRRSWERACQEGTLVSSTALPALAFDAPSSYHCISPEDFLSLSCCTFFTARTEGTHKRHVYTFANLEAGGSSAFFCVVTQAHTNHGNQAQHRLQSQHLAHSLRSTGSTFADTPAHSHPLIH